MMFIMMEHDLLAKEIIRERIKGAEDYRKKCK